MAKCDEGCNQANTLIILPRPGHLRNGDFSAAKGDNVNDRRLRQHLRTPRPIVKSQAMDIDLHGYHPRDIVWSGVLAKLVQQVWEMGESHLCLIHGHGRNRGISPGFVNTNTGYFGLEIRRALRHDPGLRRWTLHTTLDCGYPGSTTVRLRRNDSPTRTMLDPDLLP